MVRGGTVRGLNKSDLIKNSTMAMDSAYSMTVRDRAFIIHAATSPGSSVATPRPSTLEFDVNFAGPSLDAAGRVVAPAAARRVVRNALSQGFPDGSTTHCPAHRVAREVWRLVAAAGEDLGDHHVTGLAVTAKESELVSVRYTQPAFSPISPAGGGIIAPTWTVAVRNQIRAAHSFTGEQFGPCQNHHGITWVVTAEFSSRGADLDEAFADYSLTEAILGSVCRRFDLKDMDTHPDFAGGVNTTCEVMCRAVWRELAKTLLEGGGEGGEERTPQGAAVAAAQRARLLKAHASVKVLVHESDEAFVEFEQSLSAMSSEVALSEAQTTALQTQLSADATTAAAAAAAAASAAETAKALTDLNKGELLDVLHATLNERDVGADRLKEVQNMAHALAAAASEASGTVSAAKSAVAAAQKAAASEASRARFRVAVRGRAMAARTLHDLADGEDGSGSGSGAAAASPASFSPQAHGNTFVVDAVFEGRELQEVPGYMIDICLLTDLVRDTLGASIHNQSLDDPKVTRSFFGIGGSSSDVDSDYSGDNVGLDVCRNGGGGDGLAAAAVVAPTSEAVAGALWRALVTALPPVERSQTTHLRVVVSDGLFGKSEFAAPLWAEEGRNDFCVPPDPYFFKNRRLDNEERRHDDGRSAVTTGGGGGGNGGGGRTPVFLVDLDGCLFFEPLLHKGGVWGAGAIVKGVHSHCQERYGLGPQACDALHANYGDTLVGLQATGRLGKPASKPAVGAVGGDTSLGGAAAAAAAGSGGGGDAIGAYGSTLDNRVVMSIWEAADGFRGSYEQVVAHEKELNLSGSSGDLSGRASDDEHKKKQQQSDGEASNARRYFEEVFGSFDVRQVLRKAAEADQDQQGGGGGGGGQRGEAGLSVGMRHDSPSLAKLRALLSALPFPKLVASNSPASSYVLPCLQELEMGAEHVGWGGVLTPEDFLLKEAGGGGRLVTKAHAEFWQPVLARFPPDRFQLVLFDDSLANLEVAHAAGLTTYLVHHKERPLLDALLEALGCLQHRQPPSPEPSLPTPPTHQAAVVATAGIAAVQTGVVVGMVDPCAQAGAAYLDAKKVVDDPALNAHVWQSLVNSLAARRKSNGDDSNEKMSTRTATRRRVVAVDLGAGHLSMLPKVCAAVKEAGYGDGEDGEDDVVLDYLACEPQRGLVNIGLRRLEKEHGFKAVVVENAVGWYQGSLEGVGCVRVTVLAADVTQLSEADLLSALPPNVSDKGGAGDRDAGGGGGGDGGGVGPPVSGIDLVVGCSFADLVQPDLFAATILSLAPGALLYLPITFAGKKTRFATADVGTTSQGATMGTLTTAVDGGGSKKGVQSATLTVLPRWAQSGVRGQSDESEDSAAAATASASCNAVTCNAAGLLAVPPPPGHYHDDHGRDGNLNGGGGGGGVGRMPPDFVCEALYHLHLADTEGQFLGVDTLLKALTAGSDPAAAATATSTSGRNALGTNNQGGSGGVLTGGALTLLASGASDWVVGAPASSEAPGSKLSMWDAMLTFLGRSLPAELLKRGYSPAQWVRAKRQAASALGEAGVGPDGAILRQASQGGGGGSATQDESRSGSGSRHAAMVVGNVDLLLSVPSLCTWRLPAYECLVMTGPRTVEVQARMRSGLLGSAGKGGDSCGPGAGKVEVASVVSMISNGTELKFFRGDFEEAEEGEGLDATLAGLSEQQMAYPLEYGYSLVGRPVSVGKGVDAKALLLGGGVGGVGVGKEGGGAGLSSGLVFLFHPHASSACVDAKCLMPVPFGIAAADACFLPAVETALSIAHDAHPRVGETVAVFGCGLIGALVTAILAAQGGIRVVCFDGRSDRRALALRCGAAAALPPPSNQVQQQHAQGGDGIGFDVCIEVSGNPAALQSCVDVCRKGGKVVVASWYGSKVESLNLGTKFHRSHISIVASQVSEISGPASATWTKERRFACAWDLVRALKPSQLLTPRLWLPLREIGQGYEALDSGEAVACLVTYGNGEDPFGGQAADAQEQGCFGATPLCRL